MSETYSVLQLNLELKVQTKMKFERTIVQMCTLLVSERQLVGDGMEWYTQWCIVITCLFGGESSGGVGGGPDFRCRRLNIFSGDVLVRRSWFWFLVGARRHAWLITVELQWRHLTVSGRGGGRGLGHTCGLGGADSMERGTGGRPLGFRRLKKNIYDIIKVQYVMLFLKKNKWMNENNTNYKWITF